MSDLAGAPSLRAIAMRLALIVGVAGGGGALSGCAAGGLGALSEAVTHPTLPNMPSLDLPNLASFSNAKAPIHEARVATPADYIDANGGCSQPAPAEGPPGVALGMTECEIVQALGQPSRVEIGGDERGRMAVVTYTQGARPGLYRFSQGQLKSIERVGEPAPEPKSKKPAPRKRANNA